MKSVTAIRFVHFEDLGSFATVLDNQGYAIKYVDAASDQVKSVEPLGPDLLICLGGPIGAYEDDAYPALRAVLNIIERRLTVNRPTLGICLGSQLIARALGARVYPGGRKEIGWSPLRLTPDGRGSVLRRLDPGLTSVLHWHGDTFDLPEGATLLASSELYAHIRPSLSDTMCLLCNFTPKSPRLDSNDGTSDMPVKLRRLLMWGSPDSARIPHVMRPHSRARPLCS